METFVKTDSIVRQIWSDADCILFIFGASAGEFAKSKSVDWLFFTGKLPNDPIGRLFSTVVYAQKIIFEKKSSAEKTLKNMKIIHKNVENDRGFSIPNWAYQDVLFMLVAHTISAYELLHRTLSDDEKNEIYDVFSRVGLQMGIENLPENFVEWQVQRQAHLHQNYANSKLTMELFDAYRKHLGSLRFSILLAVQDMLLPKELKKANNEYEILDLSTLTKLYKHTKNLWPVSQLKFYLLPMQYRKMLRGLHRK
ncbi:oxygenase MpaB family protein [Lacihabitans sp. CCS-44]|uniref:oxygenase MpaB family protein n=1 Tax=Lacihabitans sp. CCS-44 TaxID=2487331 RepID=UPI0020CD8E24|nr:oxygenase MpaB family protein [Lacihabitans sp. CCS-44]